MEYIYAVLLLHYGKQPITEENITKVLQAAGIQPDEVRVKALVAAVKNINIEEAIKSAAIIPTAPITAPAAAPAAQAPEAKTAAQTNTPAEDTSKYVEITSPIIGTFYRKPAPDKPNFVNVGDEVQEDTVVCIVEAMKLFNEIEAEVSGKIVKVLVDDASPVEFGQPLFLVDPS